MPRPMRIDRALTAQQEQFVVGYLQHFNATKAAVDAGYSPNSAGAQGSYLLNSPKIAGKIGEILRAEQEEAFVSRFRLLLELYRMVCVDITSFFWDWGTDSMRLKQPHELDPDQRACIQSVTTRTNQKGTTISAMKTYDKIAAIQTLARMLGLIGTSKTGPAVNFDLMQHIEAQRTDERDRRLIEDPAIRAAAKRLAGLLERSPGAHGEPIGEGGVSAPPSSEPAG